MAELYDIPVSPAVPFEPQQVTIGAPVPPVDPEEMRRRTLQFHNALGQRSPGPDVLYNRLINGQEQQLRRELAVSEQRDLYNQRQQFLRNYIQNRPAEAGPPSQAELSYIQRMNSGELAEAATGEPRTYIERKLAEQSTAAVAPVRTDVSEDLGSRIDQRVQTEQMLVQYAQARLQDLQSDQRRRGDPNYVGYNTLDTIGLMASPLFWYRMQNAMGPGTGEGNFWSGNNIRSQASWYYSQSDISAATTALDKAIEAIRVPNPQNPEGNLAAAIQYLQLIVSNSSFDFTMQNLQSYLDVAPVVGWVPYGVTGRLAYNTGRRLFQRPTQEIAAAQRYATAAAQTAHAAVVNPPELAPAAVAEASGNINLAASYNARAQLLNLAEVTHGPDALSSFTKYARSIFSPESVISDVGTRLSNEAAQRLFNRMSENAETLVDTLTLRPTQVPRLPIGSPSQMEAVEETWRIASNHQYTFKADRVLDASVSYPTALTALPPKLQKPATTVFELERKIMDNNLGASYEAYRDALGAIADIRNQLRPFTKSFTKLPKVAKDRARTAGVDIDNIEMQLKDLNKFVNSLTPADRKLFSDTMKAAKKYDDLAGLMNVGVTRPSGFRAVGPVSPSLQIVQGLGNVPYVVIRIGNHNAELFPSIQAAQLSAMREFHFRPQSYKIIQQGSGYYIALYKALDETATAVRDTLRMEAKEIDPTPQPLLPFDWLQRLILPTGGSTKVSRAVGADLKAAVYSSNGAYQEIAKLVRQTIVDPIKSGGKVSQKDFNTFIEWQRTYRNPDGNRGIFSQTQMEFETQWNTVTGRYPTEKESLAYWSYVQVNNIDKLLRDVSVYRDKARAGLELHDLHVAGTNQPIGAGGLEGKVVVLDDNLWKLAQQERAGFLVWDSNPADMQHIYANARNGRKDIEKLQNNGYKVLQITHFAEKDLLTNNVTREVLDRLKAEYPNHTNPPKVDFILTREVRSSPLPLQQTPNRAGGHHQYAFTKLIRQADIRNGRYYGDNTLWGFERGPDAEFFLPRVEEARKIMNRIDASDGRVPETVLEDYVSKNLPGNFSAADFRKLFNSQYNRHLPFMITNDGENLWNGAKLVDKYPGLINALDSPLNLYQSTTLKYMMERGETPLTIVNRGTTENPSYHLSPAKQVDATATMDRAIQHAVRNATVSDVQIKSAERFIAEFSDVLSPSIDILRRDPLDAILNPQWRENADIFVLQTAKNYQRVFVESLNVKRPELLAWEAWQTKLFSDPLYSVAGEKVMIKSPGLIKTITHPIQALRNATGYYYLMTPWQFMVQAAGMANIVPHAGFKVAAESFAAAIYGKIVRDFTGVKPEAMLETIIPKLKEWGWSKQDFIEAYTLGRDTGFLYVGREHSMMDDLTQPTVRKGIAGKVLDFGMGFFRKGEETMRHMAWWAAYKMWKEKNPGLPIDEMAKIQILDQADRMSGNMSSVGMASMQRRGVTGLATTFWGYNLRMWEQLTGLDQSKLTLQQKSMTALKWIGVNSVIFGPPAALATATFLPLSSAFNRLLITTREQNPDGTVATFEDNMPVLFNFITRGALGALAPNTNISERLSPGGNRFFSEFLGEKTMAEILGGASYSAIRDTLLSTQPFWVFLMDSFTSADKQVGARITQADVERVLANVGGRGASAVMRSYWALALHQLMNNQRFNITDINQSEAIVFALTGLTPSRVTDTFDILKNEKSLRELQQYHERFIIQSWRSLNEASLNGRLEEAFQHAQDMRVHISLGHYRPDQVQALMSRIFRDKGSTVENVLRRYSQQGKAQRDFYLQYLKRLEQ